MMIQRLTQSGLAVALFIGLSGSALVYTAGQNRNDDRKGDTQGNRDTQYGGSLDPRQHGYEHAYRDGADRGRQDRDSGLAYNLQPNDYQIGARDYQRAFGNRTQYMAGYREGYKAGYDVGYNDGGRRYGELYGRRSGDPQAQGRDDVYAARAWGSTHMAFDVGYRDGVTAGQVDQGGNARSNYRATPAYQNADRGYRTSAGDRESYRMQFRDGFERGYQDGYGRSQYSTDGGGYYPAPDRGGAVDTRDGQGVFDRTLIVPANRQWTLTNMRVNRGDTVWFQATGEIRFSPNSRDRAGSAGSPDNKHVAGAPLPRELAGALIARIDNGRPFGIGNQTSVSMPASGILYLGVNDDVVRDNSGQFDVVLSW
jgi:hypothetical protein